MCVPVYKNKTHRSRTNSVLHLYARVSAVSTAADVYVRVRAYVSLRGVYVVVISFYYKYYRTAPFLVFLLPASTTTRVTASLVCEKHVRTYAAYVYTMISYYIRTTSRRPRSVLFYTRCRQYGYSSTRVRASMYVDCTISFGSVS